MASDLYNEEERSTRVLNLAQETVDFDLLETMFTDNDGKLGETEKYTTWIMMMLIRYVKRYLQRTVN